MWFLCNWWSICVLILYLTTSRLLVFFTAGLIKELRSFWKIWLRANSVATSEADSLVPTDGDAFSFLG
jgi:hypothetical protein